MGLKLEDLRKKRKLIKRKNNVTKFIKINVKKQAGFIKTS